MKNHLINILQDFRDFTNKHIMLKTYMDNILDDTALVNIIFPLLYIGQGEVTLEDGQITIKMDISIVDLLNDDRSNFTNILDNMLLCVVDFNDYYRITDSGSECSYYINGGNATPGTFVDFGQDAAGYIFNISVIIKHSIDKNNVPLDE